MKPTVAVIGAGMSGLCMAIKLQAAGIESYTVFEQAGDVGGTWRDNTYPGLHCDVPSRYYSYSFRPNHQWSKFQSPGPEIHQYLRTCAEEHSLGARIRFNTEATEARYRDGRWWIRTSDGEVEPFDVLISATGILRVPRLPDIPGRDSFAGKMFHSSQWDHLTPLQDKRIGLIGTGSTGVQIVSALGGSVKSLTVFQRSAQWIFPWPNFRYSRPTKALMGRWPAFNQLGHTFWGWIFRTVLGRATVQPGWQRRMVDAVCRWNLRLSVRDPGLRAKLTPVDQPMCKRQIFAGQYYRSVQRSGVDVVTDDIVRIEPQGVVTSGDILHELDVLVFATGFDAHAYVHPLQIVGAGGVSLEEVWADGPRAYRSIGVPGFPNFFMMMGPHSPIGSDSLVPIAEHQADFIMWWIGQMRDGQVISVAPTEVATKEHNEDMKAAMPQTTWVTGCRSWYLGRDGLPELFPWRPERYTELLAKPDTTAFEVHGPTG
ncbi:monooxygenase [Mycolicibacter heraklionensis]|uniref:Monooxygenase n=1 Tax=Mycolicibacter heraklionensis TaxID=512402 RepID=A0ABR5FGC6_9MYCO|nr:NAD(P)/FAD-dependent oxidoreductase [Mycolicibacter heraklionensis]KLO29348.1 monooxygenase [Mycolicibacter heraklionensis]